MGYSCYDFDADLDTQVLSSWSESDPSFWDNWKHFGLGAAFTGGPEEESRVVAPIQILQADDLDGNNATVSERLLVNMQDVDSIRETYTKATENDEVVILFRFATSDYFSQAATIIEPGAGFLGADKKYENQAYIASESVFFDFDIIQLTFNKEGIYTVIPVVADPIDAIGGITPPVDLPGELEWWQVVFALDCEHLCPNSSAVFTLNHDATARAEEVSVVRFVDWFQSGDLQPVKIDATWEWFHTIVSE